MRPQHISFVEVRFYISTNIPCHSSYKFCNYLRYLRRFDYQDTALLVITILQGNIYSQIYDKRSEVDFFFFAVGPEGKIIDLIFAKNLENIWERKAEVYRPWQCHRMNIGKGEKIKLCSFFCLVDFCCFGVFCCCFKKTPCKVSREIQRHSRYSIHFSPALSFFSTLHTALLCDLHATSLGRTQRNLFFYFPLPEA